MMTREPISIALAGLGNIGSQHLLQLQRNRRFRVVAIVEPDPRLAGKAAGAEPGAGVFFTLEEAIDSRKPEAVLLATPHHLHVSQTMVALEMGCHVFVEKPVALNLADFRRLLNKKEQSRKVVVVGQMMRFWPAVVWARRMIAEKRIGTPKHVMKRRIVIQKNAGNRTWAYDVHCSGGWVLYGNGVHEIDALCYILECGLAEVSAYGSKNNPIWNDIDELSLSGRFANGAVFSLSQSLNGPEFIFDTIIIGNKGALKIDTDNKGWLNGEEIVFARDNALQNQLDEFFMAIRNNQNHRSSLERLGPTMESLDLAMRSLKCAEK